MKSVESLVPLDIRNASVEAVRAATARQVDLAVSRALLCGDPEMLHHAVVFVSKFIVCSATRANLTTRAAKDVDIPVEAISSLGQALCAGPAVLIDQTIRDFFLSYIQNADLIPRRGWADVLAAMRRRGFALHDGALSLLALLRKKKAIGEGLIEMWVRDLSYSMPGRGRVQYISELTRFAGAMMEELLPINLTPIEKDIMMFTAVLKICTDAAAAPSGGDTMPEGMSPIVFVLPLWTDLWKTLTQHRSHGLTLLGLHLSCVAVELFPETINETLHFSSDHSMCTMDRVINFLLNLAMDEGSAWVVREKAVLTGLRLLTSCVSCLHSSVQRVFSCLGALLSLHPPKSTQYAMLRVIDGFLASNPFQCCFEDLVTCAMAIEVCRVNMEEGEHRNAAILFLSTFSAEVAPVLVSILVCSSRDAAAGRTLRIVESIFTSTAIGVDGHWFLSDSEGTMTEDARAVMKRIFLARCMHFEAVMEMCEGTVASVLLSSGRGFDLSLYPSLVDMPTLFPREVVNKVAVRIADRLGNVDVLDEEVDVVSGTLPTLVSAVLFLPSSPDVFRPHCVSFIRALPMVKDSVCRGGENTYSLAVGLWLRILKCFLMARPDVLPYEHVERMRMSVFPDLLKVRSIVDSAISLSLSLPDGMQNLFECIGYYQDEALLENSRIAGIIHYIELIDSAVTENVKEVRNHYYNLCSQRIEEAHKTTGVSGSYCVGEVQVDSMHGMFGMDAEYIDEEPPETTLEIVDDKALERQTYMQDAIVQEDCHKLEKRALHDSVCGSSSFLGCFVPFLAAIAGDDSIHAVLRVPVLRALGKYMACSSELLQSYSPLLKSILFMSHAFGDAHPMLPVVLQSLHSWYTAYKPGVSDPTVLLSVVSIICAGENRQRVREARPLIILRCTVDCLSSMITGGMVRVREQHGFAIAVSLHWSYKHKYEALQHHIRMRIVELCDADDKLLSRIVFYMIKLNDDDAAEHALSVSPQMCVSVCHTLVVSLICETSHQCINQLNAIGEKLITEILVTGDIALVPYAGQFPLTKASSAMLTEAVDMSTNGNSSKLSEPVVGAALAPDLLRELLDRPCNRISSDYCESSDSDTPGTAIACVPDVPYAADAEPKRPVLKRARVVYSSDSQE